MLKIVTLSLSLFLFLIMPLATAADTVPGAWVEAETAVDGQHPAKEANWASGGHYLDFIGAGTRLTLQVELREPIADAGLWVRWAAGGATTIGFDVVVDPGKPTAGRLELTRPMSWSPAPYGADWHRPAWSRLHLGALPAGKTRIVLTGAGEGGGCILDCAGIAPWRDGLWSPPAKVENGVLSGPGVLMPPITLGVVQDEANIGLYAGEKVLGAGKPPLVFKIRLRNNRDDRAVQARLSANLATEEASVSDLPVQSVEIAPGSEKTVDVSFAAPGYGWYELRLSATVDGGSSEASTSFAVIRPAARGVRPDSIFGFNMDEGKPAHLAIAEAIGIKWRRGVPGTSTNLVAPNPGQWWDASAIAAAKKGWQDWRDHGVLSLGYVNYNAPWNAREMAGRGSWQVPPKDLAVHAEAVRRMIEPFKDDVKYWELWNEPVPGGHFWGGTAQDYRDMCRAVWDAVKPTMPDIQLIGGSYTHTLRDMVLADGARNAGYVDGSASHPYGQPNLFTPVSGALERAMLERDARGKGKAGVWFTELGTLQWGGPAEQHRFLMARTMAPFYLLNQLGVGNGVPCKVFMFTIDYRGNGDPSYPGNLYGRGTPDPAIATFSALTHFTEDGVLQGDLWSASKQGWALHYLKPDGSSVVALWPERGLDLDYNRSVRITLPAEDFQVFDRYGRPAGTRQGADLVLSARTWEVHYLVSAKKSVAVAAAVRAARLVGVDRPIQVAVKSLTAPVDRLPTLRIRLENRMLQPTDATLTIEAPTTLTLANKSMQVKALAPGATRWVEIPLTAATADPSNSYLVRWHLTSAFGGQSGEQLVQVACATYGTPVKPADWDQAIPVRIRNPGRWNDWHREERPLPMEVGEGYTMRTMWDDQRLYLSATVRDLTPKPGDCLQFAFHCLERNPDDLLAGHVLRGKCLASDVDYEFKAGLWRLGEYTSAIPDLYQIVPPAAKVDEQALQGCVPQLVRLCAPGTRRQNPPTSAYNNPQTTPPLGPMDATVAGGRDGQVRITYDQATKTYRYEVALTWDALGPLAAQVRGLKPGAATRTNFTFHVIDQSDWHRRTYWEETEGDVELAAEGLAFRPGTPCWSNDYQLRILAEWGFVRPEAKQ